MFRNERDLLERSGMEVIPYERFNDDIDESTFRKRCELALAGAWSRRSYDEVAKIIRETRPDIAHFHNTFPQISPSAYAACQDNGVPVVQTLHNYRLICANALLTRDGKPCEACVGTSLLPALRYRCYRDSLPATGALVWMLARNRWHDTYRRLVDCYIALTRFAAERLAEGGLPADKITVKPNFLEAPDPRPGGREPYAIFVGRLSGEKGVRTLIRAWRNVRALPLKILGDGPLRAETEDEIERQGVSVELLGQQPKSNVLSMVRGATLQVVPSECYEGFPMVLLEAFASGTPVVASNIGSLAEIVGAGRTGRLFRAGDPDDLARHVEALAADPAHEAYGRSAREEYEQKYTPARNLQQLMAVYQGVMIGAKAS